MKVTRTWVNPNRLAWRLCLLVGMLTVVAGCATTNPPYNGDTITVTPLEELPTVVLEDAELALSGKRYAEAQRFFSRILQADPENTRAKLGWAETLLGMGENEAAVEVFDGLVDDPTFGARALQGKGIALLLTGQSEASQKALEAAVAEDSALWRAWNTLGQYYDSQRQWKVADASYRKALEARPDKAVIHNNIGVSLLLQSRFTDAETKFTEALQLAPSNDVVRTNLRLVLAFQGRYIEAMAGVSRNGVPEALNNMGYVAILRGDYTRAEAYLVRAMEASPDFSESAWKNMRYLESLKTIREENGDGFHPGKVSEG